MSEVVRWPRDQALVIRNAQARDFLVEQGVPRSTLLFEAATGVPSGTFATNDGCEVAVIGDFDADFRFYVDVDRGYVLFGLDGDASPTFVNETVSGFVACLLEFDGKFPFYSFEDAPEMKRTAGRDLAADIDAIDPQCLVAANGFWRSIVHDVSIGDYYEGSL